MSTVINVTHEQRENLLVGALEGGSNYWYYLTPNAIDIVKSFTPNSKDPLSVRAWRAIEAGATIPIHDVERDEQEQIGEISLASIEKGEQIMATKYAHHFADIINENDDAITSDVWFQLASLGEIVYG